MHDTGHTNLRLAALRHHNAKGEKRRCRIKKEARKTFAVYCCIIVQHSNKILMRTAAPIDIVIFYFLFRQTQAAIQHALCVYRRQSTQFMSFHISL